LLLLLFVFFVRPSLSKSAAPKFVVTSSTVGASFASAFVVFKFFLLSEKDDEFLLFSFVEDATTEMLPFLPFRCFVETKLQRLRRNEGGVSFPKSR
jgi:hypothetical protein